MEALGRRVVQQRVDGRDFGALQEMLDAAVAGLGRLDVVVANAGIVSARAADALAGECRQDMIDVNFTGGGTTPPRPASATFGPVTPAGRSR